MKTLLIIASLTLVACAHPHQIEQADDGRGIAADINTHKTAYPHTHNHGENCGHQTVESDGVTYYKHNGEKHFKHAGHVDIK